MPHCDEVGHKLITIKHPDGTESEHCVRTIHAEQNAVIQAAFHGISLRGATLYCKMTPCAVCAGFIVGAGIIEVKCLQKYKLPEEGEEILANAGVKISYVSEEVVKY